MVLPSSTNGCTAVEKTEGPSHTLDFRTTQVKISERVTLEIKRATPRSLEKVLRSVSPSASSEEHARNIDAEAGSSPSSPSNLLPSPGSCPGKEDLPYWSIIWEPSLALARFVLSLDLSRLSVLEIGAGTAIAGIAAGRVGAEPLLISDFEESAVELARENALLNKVKADTRCLDWRDTESWPKESFDVLLGADILYSSASGKHIARLLKWVLREGGVAVLADPGRPYRQSFVEACLKHEDEEDKEEEATNKTEGRSCLLSVREHPCYVVHGGTGVEQRVLFLEVCKTTTYESNEKERKEGGEVEKKSVAAEVVGTALRSFCDARKEPATDFLPKMAEDPPPPPPLPTLQDLAQGSSD